MITRLTTSASPFKISTRPSLDGAHSFTPRPLWPLSTR